MTMQFERCAMLDRAAAQATKRPFRRERRPEERVSLLGGAMDLVRAPEVFHYASSQIAAGRQVVIANHNLHSLYLLRKHPDLRRFFARADLVEIDSMPLILWARLMGRPSRRFHRCTYLDWRSEFWDWIARDNLKVFFVGGAPGVGGTALEEIREHWPTVRAATHHGYFDASVENEDVCREIRDFAPQVLLVGMGMPRQELWVLQNLERLPNCAIFTVGGAFDYEAGVQSPCPRWLGLLGAEWLYRLLTNPRLVRRYTLEPWSLLGPALHDIGARWKRRFARRNNAGAH
jgi:N-acetylglucosaminyldiphosphoundecaprenol N-acetyl-beta-D-mannosaminyltransferase